MPEFAVILFEDGLQLVPCCWLTENNKKCYWPSESSQIKLNKMVAGQILPGEDWKLFAVSRLFGYTDDYTKGIEKLKLCIDISDINSDVSEGEIKRKKRKLVQERLVDSGSDEERIQTISKLPPFPNPPLDKAQASKEISFDRMPEGILEGNPSVSASASFEAAGLMGNSVPFGAASTSNTNVDTKFQDLVIRKLNRLFRRIDALEEKMDFYNKNSKKSPLLPETELLDKFPLASDDDLLEFEEFIKEEENMKKFVITLKCIGGIGEFHVVSNMLKRVIANPVAELYSWHGAKGKKAFKKLNLTKGLLAATRLHFPLMTEESVWSIVSNWLRHAKQRRERAEEKK